MYKSIVAALGVVGKASAQGSVLNLFLLGFTSQRIVGSIIISVSSAEKCSTSLADFQNRTQQRQHIHSIVVTQTKLCEYRHRSLQRHGAIVRIPPVDL